MDADPVGTYPSLVPTRNNVFEGLIRTIHIDGGTANTNATCLPGMATRYAIDNTVTVASTVTLSIGENVKVFTTSSYGNGYDFIIEGIVLAVGAQFTGSTEVFINNGGLLDLSNCQITGNYIKYQNPSYGQVQYTVISLPLHIDAASTVQIKNCDFSSGTAIAVGGSSRTIDLMRNYWGTTDLVAIDAKITDKDDDSSLPDILVEPWLLAAPSESLFYIVSYSPSGATNVLTDCIEITFNREVDLTTFSAEDIEVVGGGQSYTIAGITPSGGLPIRYA